MRPAIDTFHGRLVTAVISHGGDDSDWGIELEGGIIIWNTDARRTSRPDETKLQGLSFISSSTDDSNVDLDFGNVDQSGAILNATGISLTTTKYRIVGPGISDEDAQDETGEIPIFVLPPDPSDERVVDGPSEEWIEAHGGEMSAKDHAAWIEAQKAALEAPEEPQEATDD